MKRLIVLLFLFVLGHVGFSQTDTNVLHVLNLAKKHTNFQTFETEIDSFIARLPNERTVGQLKFHQSRNPYRSFGVGFASYTIQFGLTQNVSGSRFSSDNYKLTLFFDDHDWSIFYVRLVEWDYYRREYEWDVFLDFDSTQFESYFARHDSIFNTTTPRNYVNPPFINDNYYGPLCGNHDSEQYHEMMGYVDTDQKEPLVNWIKSFNLENKAYGLHGLYFLSKKGVELTEEEEQLLLTMKQMGRTRIQTDLGLEYFRVLIHETRLDRKFEQYTK